MMGGFGDSGGGAMFGGGDTFGFDDFGGGGFMSEEKSEELQLGGSGGRGFNEHVLLPVWVRSIFDAHKQGFQLGGVRFLDQSLDNVRVVGVISSLTRDGETTKFHLDDGSGKLIACNWYMNACEDVTNYKRSLMEQTCVEDKNVVVYGCVAALGADLPSLKVQNVRPVPSFDFIWMHHLEVAKEIASRKYAGEDTIPDMPTGKGPTSSSSLGSLGAGYVAPGQSAMGHPASHAMPHTTPSHQAHEQIHTATHISTATDKSSSGENAVHDSAYDAPANTTSASGPPEEEEEPPLESLFNPTLVANVKRDCQAILESTRQSGKHEGLHIDMITSQLKTSNKAFQAIISRDLVAQLLRSMAKEGLAMQTTTPEMWNSM